MPEFYQESTFANDPSQLSEGWRPAFLCLITDDPKPEGWQMRGDRMWRWHFAVWNSLSVVATQPPEHQSAVSSKTFSPGGKNPPSKAYEWTVQLLERRPTPGERVNLDPLMPIPCRLKISRQKNDGTPIDFANIKDLETAPDDLKGLLTPELKSKLQALAAQWQGNGATEKPVTSPGEAAAPTPPPVTNPGFAGWGNPQGAVVPPQSTPSW